MKDLNKVRSQKLYQIFSKSFRVRSVKSFVPFDSLLISDEFGKTDKAFAIAGCNDTDAKSATTTLVTPGFKANQHPHECLTFYYYIQVYQSN